MTYVGDLKDMNAGHERILVPIRGFTTLAINSAGEKSIIDHFKKQTKRF